MNNTESQEDKLERYAYDRDCLRDQNEVLARECDALHELVSAMRADESETVTYEEII